MVERETICPVCGAYSRSRCEINEMAGAAEGEIDCMWDEVDPDILREERDERARLEREDRK